MTRAIEQILADEKIEISERLIRTPEMTIYVGDGWILNKYYWPAYGGYRYIDGPSPVAVAVLIAAVWVLARPIPPDMPWLIPVGFAAAIGATWSIGRSLLNRWLEPSREPRPPKRGVTFWIAGSEDAATIFASDDEQEIDLVKQELEKRLLPKNTNGD